MELSELEELITFLAEYEDDPYGYVMAAYPWGVPGSELENYSGPQDWQRQILEDLGKGVIDIQEAIRQAVEHNMEAETAPLQFARTSGHGIGKSALVAWIIDWAQSTKADTKGVVTANTENQLKTKTWAELAKWHRLSLSSPLFKMTATARFSIDPEHERTWRIDMVPWSEKNTEAFAGLHNKGRRILLVFDEASAIPDIIWETAEGALTDNNTEIIWTCFGNPTRNSGRFRECFEGGKFSHRWDHAAISSMDVDITNKTQLQKWIDDYGEDHDFVRVRVLGKFPRVDASSFIPLEDARAATTRALPEDNPAPIVLGVDVARFGSDKSIIYPRQGLDARSRQPVVLQGVNTMQLATRVFNEYMRYQATAIFVDGGGVGGGVVDRLLQMGAPVYEVGFGNAADGVNPDDPYIKYENKRAEIWGAGKSWLQRGGCIPDEVPMIEEAFSTELSNPTYTMTGKEGDRILLESKKDMKRRGLSSPDLSDALFCTFAYPTLEQTFDNDPDQDRHTQPNDDNYYSDKFEENYP